MGGRGSGSSGGTKFSFSNGKWGNGVYFTQNDTLKEALGERGAPKTMGDAMIETNPYYNGDYHEYSENCQRVVVAYEARRRGYDVTAQPTYPGDTLNQVAYVDNASGISRGRWMGAFQNAKPVNVSATNSDAVINNIETKMAGYGNGSRGVVQLFYKGGGGHVFNVEQKNGKTHFVEAQTGVIKNLSYLKTVMRPERVALVRTDNLKFSDRAKNFVTTKK